MKIERISSQNGSPRCPTCKAHVTNEDIECPICGALLIMRPAIGKSLSATRPEKPKEIPSKTKTSQTGGFKPFQLPANDKPALSSAAAPKSVAQLNSGTPASKTPSSTPAESDPAGPRTKPIRPLVTVDEPKPIVRPETAVPIRRASSTQLSPSKQPTSSSTTPRAAAAAKPTPRLKPPPGGARKPAERLPMRWVFGLIGLVVVVGLGIALVRFGMGLLSSSAKSATPTVQVKVVFSGQVTTPTLAASTLEVTPAATLVMSAADSISPTVSALEAMVATDTPVPQPTAEATANETAVPTETPAPTATPLPATATATSTTVPNPTAATTVAPTVVVSSAFIDYTVQAGDTCSEIAKTNNVSVASFAATNLLDTGNCVLKVGNVVRIPRVPATAAASVAGTLAATPAFATQAEYTVASGDTCGGIAYRFKITAAQLVAANNLGRTSCFLKVGQKLIIPKTDAVIPVATLASKPTAISTTRDYTVQQGDVCGAIAKRFGISVTKLAAANNLNPDSCPLRVGRTLVIPTP